MSTVDRLVQLQLTSENLADLPDGVRFEALHDPNAGWLVRIAAEGAATLILAPPDAAAMVEDLRTRGAMAWAAQLSQAYEDAVGRPTPS